MIDVHAHCPSERGLWGLAAPYPSDAYLTFMDRAGIDASVICTMDGLIYPTSATNDEVARFVSVDRARLVGLATVEPRFPASVAEVDRCLSQLHFAGLKLHPLLQGFAPTEPGTMLDEICGLVAEHHGVVLFHDGTAPYSTALQIAVLARRHPRVAFVLGHAGGRDLWPEAIAAVCDVPNVYACLGTSTVLATRQLVARCPLGQLLFGTDAGLGSIAQQVYVLRRIEGFEALGLPAHVEAAIRHTNPRRLFERHLSS